MFELVTMKVMQSSKVDTLQVGQTGKQFEFIINKKIILMHCYTVFDYMF